jgi:hypothetical protein
MLDGHPSTTCGSNARTCFNSRGSCSRLSRKLETTSCRAPGNLPGQHPGPLRIRVRCSAAGDAAADAARQPAPLPLERRKLESRRTRRPMNRHHPPRGAAGVSDPHQLPGIDKELVRLMHQMRTVQQRQPREVGKTPDRGRVHPPNRRTTCVEGRSRRRHPHQHPKPPLLVTSDLLSRRPLQPSPRPTYRPTKRERVSNMMLHGHNLATPNWIGVKLKALRLLTGWASGNILFPSCRSCPSSRGRPQRSPSAVRAAAEAFLRPKPSQDAGSQWADLPEGGRRDDPKGERVDEQEDEPVEHH